MRILISVVLMIFLVGGCAASHRSDGTSRLIASMEPVDGEAVLDEVDALVRAEFFDPDLRGVDWSAEVEARRAQARSATTLDELDVVINDLLDTLDTSHTHFFGPHMPRYFQLIDIFSVLPRFDRFEAYRVDGGFPYPGLGIHWLERDGVWFVGDVIDGGPGVESGLKRGDAVESADGAPFHPVRSFLGRVGAVVELEIQRDGPDAPRLRLHVVPELIRSKELFLESIAASARVIESSGTRYAYVRARSYAGQDMNDAVLDAVSTEAMRACDHLLLDLRGGWGGASGEYLGMFMKEVPEFGFVRRDGTYQAVDRQWRKPVTMLIDESVRSGKEILAYAFRAHDLGRLVGRTTAGAVVGGTPFVLSNGCVLYLAVLDCRVDGVRLEGVGVAPDVVVADDLEWARGGDAVIDAAVGR